MSTSNHTTDVKGTRPAVRIQWIDSGMHVDKGWKSLEDYKTDINISKATVETVGILMHEDEDSLMVGLSYDPTHDAWYGAQWVLKPNIVSVEYLDV